MKTQDLIIKKIGRPQTIKGGKVLAVNLSASNIAKLDAIHTATGENRSAIIRRLIQKA